MTERKVRRRRERRKREREGEVKGLTSAATSLFIARRSIEVIAKVVKQALIFSCQAPQKWYDAVF